jgi:hypothetical protein
MDLVREESMSDGFERLPTFYAGRSKEMLF